VCVCVCVCVWCPIKFLIKLTDFPEKRSMYLVPLEVIICIVMQCVSLA
jgi:hypothetical protein